MYFLLPETENRTLEDIELHFSDNKRKLTDIRIRRVGDLSKASPLPPRSDEIIEIKPMTPSVVLDIVSAPKIAIDRQLNGCVNNAFTGDDVGAKVQ